MPKMSLIVAKSRNNVIGVDGDLPWRLSSDLKFFKKTTMGKPVMMGRVTWESLPFPLPGRPNLVLTRDKSYSDKRAETFHNPIDMIGRAYELAGTMNVDEIMLIGGAKLYAALMPYCARMYVSDVNVELSGDAHFPEIDLDQWDVSSETAVPKSSSDDYDFTVKIFDRKLVEISVLTLDKIRG